MTILIQQATRMNSPTEKSAPPKVIGSKNLFRTPIPVPAKTEPDSLPTPPVTTTMVAYYQEDTRNYLRVAKFAGLGLGDSSGDYFAAGLMVSGVFLGSALWWVGLGGAVSVFQERGGPRGLRAINRLSGLLIGGFGVGALALAAPGLA